MGRSPDPQLHTAPIDLDRLTQRFRWYGSAHGVSSKAIGDMEEILRSPTVTELLKLPPEEWDDILVNDIYKATMHRMYAAFLGGVTAEFALHVRRSPMTLHALAQTHPHVFQALHARITRLRDVQPYGPAVQQALRVHGTGFELTQEMVCRAEAYGVAPVSWSAECCNGIPRSAVTPQAPGAPAGQQGCARAREGPGDLSPAGTERTGVTPELRSQECDVSLVGEGWVNLQDKDCSCIAAGPIESASHCETTIMQLVQEAFIAAQVEDIREQYQQTTHGSDRPACPADHVSYWPDRTELLASSLAHLCHVIDALNSRPHGMSISLFAGRRSSDRLFLVLQNLAFAQMVQGYGGTSSVYAASMLGKVWDILGWSAQERVACLGPLVGTHAHEQTSMLQQLLADLDLKAGQEAASPSAQGTTSPSALAPPLPLTSLLAHLLFLTANGDLRLATALPDTFGTPGFIRLALAADVPEAFRERLMSASGQTVHTGAKCFDLFRVWRVDSGSYEEIAELIISAWEERCRALALQPPHAPDGAQAPYPAASVVEGPAAANPANAAGAAPGAAAVDVAAGTAVGAAIGEAVLMEGLEHSSSNSNSTAATSGGSSGNAGRAKVGSGAVTVHPPSPPALPRPVLMHSNLSSVQEVLQVADLPERIQPQIVAFGTLADGFFPLVPPQGTPSNQDTDLTQQTPAPVGPDAGSGAGPGAAGPYPVQMASLVMKAVQARAPKVTVTQPSALKIGDLSAGASESKVEQDLRLGPEAQEEMRQLVEAMRRAEGPWDEGLVSRAVAAAYRQVVEEHLLQP